MPQTERQGRAGILAVYASFVLAGIPALMVFFFLERVPTMLVPVVASGLPLLAKTDRQAIRFRVVALILLSLVVILGTLSVGRFFIPSAIAMAIACAKAKSSPGDSAP